MSRYFPLVDRSACSQCIALDLRLRSPTVTAMEANSLLLENIGRELRRALPSSVAVFTHLASASLPIPEAERHLVARAVATRQAEFIAGRWCAHRALEKIGWPSEFLAVGPRGEPLWPEGARASITHDSSLCAAVAAPASAVSGIGIDIIDTSREMDVEGIAHLIAFSDDRFSTSKVQNVPERTLLCFSVKEAVVKTISARVGRYLELHEIHTEIGEEHFSAQLAGGRLPLTGTWARVGVFFVTTSSIPA